MKQGVKGYFSVEAALILPAVLGVYLFLICILMVQYDRCLLEQDMAAMLVKAGSHGGSPQQQLEYLQQLTAGWDREQYLWLEPQAPHFVLRGQQIRLEASGEYVMPVYAGLEGVGGSHRLEWTFKQSTWDRAALAGLLAGQDTEDNE